jgi:hypothetical protein
MSNLEDRSAARKVMDEFGPLYPNLGPAVVKHRRLNDQTPEGRKAYGQAVHAAIRALQRRELMSAAYERASLPPDIGAMSNKQFIERLRKQASTLHNIPSAPKGEWNYYRALLEGRGVSPQKILDCAPTEVSKSGYKSTLWLKAAWNVIKTKRGTPYLVETKIETKAEPIELTPVTNKKKRGRPLGSKNRPRPILSINNTHKKSNVYRTVDNNVYRTGDNQVFLSLDGAKAHANAVFRRTGIVISIEPCR